MAWFPVFANFMEGEDFKRLTPPEKLLFFHLVSEFNLRDEFYQADLEVAKTLATSEKTIRRGRTKLTKLGLINVKPGTRTHRNQFLATRYLGVKYATMEEEGFFAQVPRFTFQALLHCLRKSRLKAGDVVVYVCLSYWYWRNRGKYEDRNRFFITKKELQSLTNLRDASKRVPRLYEAFLFSNGSHLFEYKEDYHRFTFKNWSICADPDENDQSRRNAESYLREIKESVALEKRERQLKVQQKIQSLIAIFDEHYLKKYGRRPHRSFLLTKRFQELEENFGRSAVFNALDYYFTADEVPNGTNTKTRTLGNFVTNINEIFTLRHMSGARV